MSENAKPCPDCGQVLLIAIGSGFHCNGCGANFLADGVNITGCTKAELKASKGISDEAISRTFGRFGRPQ